MVTHWPAFLRKEHLKTCYLNGELEKYMGMSLRAQKARIVLIGLCA